MKKNGKHARISNCRQTFNETNKIPKNVDLKKNYRLIMKFLTHNVNFS